MHWAEYSRVWWFVALLRVKKLGCGREAADPSRSLSESRWPPGAGQDMMLARKPHHTLSSILVAV